MDRRYRIVVFAPDRHLTYDGRTPDTRGVGGGVMVRIRLAQAWARAGHDVRVICNCSRGIRFEGVRYEPLDHAGPIDCDVLILNSSAGIPDLRPAQTLTALAALRVVRVDGTAEPLGLKELPYDFVYSPSDFVAHVALTEWDVPREKVVVFPHGVERWMLTEPSWLQRRRRKLHRLVYAGHPDKGLAGALGVLSLLRQRDRRYHLHAFGGDGLYGKPDHAPAPAAGLTYHGTVAHRALFQGLQTGTFSLGLQAREEPFGLVLVESMAAGCIPIVSRAGAYPEIVHHGHDGFIVDGDHLDPRTWAHAAEFIQRLVTDPSPMNALRQNVRRRPNSWDDVARAMADHWLRTQ